MARGRALAAYGSDTALLVKLLDAGQRLPVHAHPDVAFAAEHLGLAHGKTEAWVVLEPARVHLGFAREVGADELAGWVRTQDRRRDARRDARARLDAATPCWCPRGSRTRSARARSSSSCRSPPTCRSCWSGPARDRRPADGHLGLGFDVALAAVDRRGWSAAEIAHLRGATAASSGDLLPQAAAFFRVERWTGPRALDAGLAVLVVIGGTGTLVAQGERSPLQRGHTVLLPASAGSVTLEGADLHVVVCRPPRP